MENLYPLPPTPLRPKSRMGKWRVLAFTRLHPWFGGGGGGGGLLFHFILSKIVVLTEFNYPNQRNVHKNWRNKNIQRKNKTEIELK